MSQPSLARNRPHMKELAWARARNGRRKTSCEETAIGSRLSGSCWKYAGGNSEVAPATTRCERGGWHVGRKHSGQPKRLDSRGETRRWLRLAPRHANLGCLARMSRGGAGRTSARATPTSERASCPGTAAGNFDATWFFSAGGDALGGRGSLLSKPAQTSYDI